MSKTPTLVDTAEFVSTLPLDWVWTTSLDPVGAQQDEQSGRTDPDDFGRYYWSLLSGLCVALPDAIRARHFHTLLRLVERVLPCPGCKHHMAEFMTQHDPAAVDWNNRNASMQWLFRLRTAVRDRNVKDLELTPAKACLKRYAHETSSAWTKQSIKRTTFVELWQHDVLSTFVFAVRVAALQISAVRTIVREFLHLVLWLCAAARLTLIDARLPSAEDVTTLDRCLQWIDSIPLAKQSAVVWALLRVSPFAPPPPHAVQPSA